MFFTKEKTVGREAGSNKGEEHKSPAVTEQRQWDTRHGHQTNVHADVDEHMTEEQRHHTHRQKFAQAIARLAGDADSSEQKRGVEGENRHAAQETFLLGNHRENEVVVGGARRKESERYLLAAPPAFAFDATGTDG